MMKRESLNYYTGPGSALSLERRRKSQRLPRISCSGVNMYRTDGKRGDGIQDDRFSVDQGEFTGLKPFLFSLLAYSVNEHGICVSVLWTASQILTTSAAFVAMTTMTVISTPFN